MSYNEGIPVEFFEKHLYNFSWELLDNESLPLWFIEKYADMFNCDIIPYNKDTPIELYEKYIGDPKWELDWYGISSGESIPLWFYEKYADRVDWGALSGNESFVKQLKMKELTHLLMLASRAVDMSLLRERTV